MISYAEALKILEAVAKPLHPQSMALGDLHGAVLAEDIVSPMAVPSFNNSAMDGFAVRCHELAGASPENPVLLPVVARIAAGDRPLRAYPPLTVCEITTGSEVPPCFDAVVPVESAQAQTASQDRVCIAFARPPVQSDNVRYIGEDFSRGDLVLAAGAVMTAEAIMASAALGLAKASVRIPPALYLFATGNELVELGAPLSGGQINESNVPYLMAAAKRVGLSAFSGGIVDDSPQSLARRLSQVPPESIIITTGAVSKGRFDFIPALLNDLGATIHFHKVSIRPGKPILFASLPNGSWFFGLPGNPVSAAVGFRFFVQPLIDRLLQKSPSQNPLPCSKRPFPKKSISPFSSKASPSKILMRG